MVFFKRFQGGFNGFVDGLKDFWWLEGSPSKFKKLGWFFKVLVF